MVSAVAMIAIAAVGAWNQFSFAQIKQAVLQLKLDVLERLGSLERELDEKFVPRKELDERFKSIHDRLTKHEDQYHRAGPIFGSHKNK